MAKGAALTRLGTAQSRKAAAFSLPFLSFPLSLSLSNLCIDRETSDESPIRQRRALFRPGPLEQRGETIRYEME